MWLEELTMLDMTSVGWLNTNKNKECWLHHEQFDLALHSLLSYSCPNIIGKNLHISDLLHKSA